MSDRSSTTLGYEWSTNPLLDRSLSEAAFVDQILGSVPPRPPYYARMKELNANGPRALGGLPGDRELDLTEFSSLLDDGAVVVDLRDQSAFGGAHIPGSFGIGANGNVSGWSSWVVPYERPIVLVCEPRQRRFAIRSLIRVGLDDVRGSLVGGFPTWREAGRPVATVPQWSVVAAARALEQNELTVIDVRSESEYDAGHIPGAESTYLGFLADASPAQPRSGRVGLVCRTGYRSTVAASVLARRGDVELVNITGGMEAWKRAGLPIEGSE